MNSRPKRMHLAVPGSLPLRENHHRTPISQLFKYGFETLAGKAFLVDGDRIEPARQHSKKPVIK
jgi:hypothetical protein